MTDSTDTTAGQYLTVPEVAAELGCGRTIVYDHIRAGRLEAFSIGISRRKGLRVRRADLDAFIAAQP